MQNTRNPQNPFSPQSSTCYTLTLCQNSHRELYCTNAISVQVINSIYPSFNMIHICFLVIFPLALQFPQVFIFRSHRDNFIKFLKIMTVSFFLVNNSRQFCTKYFCSQKRRCPVKSPEGDTKLKESHQ